MHITPVDDKKDLFLVDQILTDEMIQQLSHEVLEELPYTKQEWQETWNRKRLMPMPGSTLQSIADHYNDNREQISKATGLEITQIDTRFWLDYHDFDCPKHLDNDGIDYVMQIFLSDAPKDLGTVFYEGDKIRKAFDFNKNTGYIMFNNDKQMHGMENKVPETVQRLTSYSYFQTKQR